MSSPGTTRPRRIALVTNGLTRAGAETQLVRLAAALREHGDEVGVVSILPTEAFADDLAALGVPIAHLQVGSALKGPTAIAAGTRVLRAWQPDALISFVYQANVLGRIAGRLAGVPVIISSVRNEYFGGRSRELVLRATDRLSAATTTNSATVAAGLVARRIVRAESAFVIRNGIDPTPVQQAATRRPQARAALGIPDDQFAWLAAGRLEPQKDYPNLLSALARVRTDTDHVVLVAGQGALLDDLEDHAAELGVTDRVRFLGVRSDIPELIAAADAVVLSSRHEGLPNIVMEAMAGSRPVVATRVGGTPELIDDRSSGLLVPPEDPDALAGALAEVMALPRSQHRAMGAAGQKIIAEHYSLEAFARGWLDLLDECLRDARHPDRDARSPLSAAVAGAVR